MQSLPEDDDINLADYLPIVNRHNEILGIAIWNYDQTDYHQYGDDFLKHPNGSWNDPSPVVISKMLKNHCEIFNEYQTSFIPCKIVAILQRVISDGTGIEYRRKH